MLPTKGNPIIFQLNKPDSIAPQHNVFHYWNGKYNFYGIYYHFNEIPIKDMIEKRNTFIKKNKFSGEFYESYVI